MNRARALEILRETFKNRLAEDLKRQYQILQWFLNDEDKIKILGAIRDKQKKESTLHPMVKKALSVLGGRLI